MGIITIYPIVVNNNFDSEVLMELNKVNKDTLAHNILNSVIERAKEYYACCPNDFIIDSFSDDYIIFGVRNRLVWNIESGFSFVKMNCSIDFINHYFKV